MTVSMLSGSTRRLQTTSAASTADAGACRLATISPACSAVKQKFRAMLLIKRSRSLSDGAPPSRPSCLREAFMRVGNTYESNSKPSMGSSMLSRG